jgi:hypothetical protein
MRRKDIYLAGIGIGLAGLIGCDDSGGRVNDSEGEREVFVERAHEVDRVAVVERESQVENVSGAGRVYEVERELEVGGDKPIVIDEEGWVDAFEIVEYNIEDFVEKTGEEELVVESQAESKKDIKKEVEEGKKKIVPELVSPTEDGIEELSPESQRVLEEKLKAREEIDAKVRYDLIKENAIDGFLREYLKNVIPRSGNFKKTAKKHGGLEEYLKVYAENHVELLDAAFEDRESNEDYGKLVEKLAVNMGKDGGKVDYEDAKVKEQLGVWARSRVGLFNTLLSGQIPEGKGEEAFREMVRSVYDEKSLGEWLKGQHDANEKLYDAMHGTLSGVEKSFGGNKEFGIIREETINIYNSVMDWLKEEKNGKK